MAESKQNVCGGCGAPVGPGIRFCCHFCKKNPKPKAAKTDKAKKTIAARVDKQTTPTKDKE